MKLVKNYENVMQKIVTLSDKFFIIDVDTSSKIIIVDTFLTFNQKKKFERSSKLSTTVFKSLIIIVDSFTSSILSIVIDFSNINFNYFKYFLTCISWTEINCCDIFQANICRFKIFSDRFKSFNSSRIFRFEIKTFHFRSTWILWRNDKTKQ